MNIKSITPMNSGTMQSFFCLTAGILTFLWVVIHLIYGDIFFDADQAVIGLMGKDLAAGRAFPWTYYGQKYMLAVEAWVAGFVFFISGGISVATLKLPLAMVHITTSVMAVKIFIRDCKLSPFESLLSAAPLIMPAVVTGAYLMGSNGANAWPAFYIVLLWTLRHRSFAPGFILGFAYFHREFVIFGALALIICDLMNISENIQSKAQRFDLWKRRIISFVVAQLTYHGLVGLGRFNENFYGSGRPRTHWHDFYHVVENLDFLASTMLPTLSGINSIPVSYFGLNASSFNGVFWWVSLNAILLLTLIIAVGYLIVRQRQNLRTPLLGFSLYCFLSAAGQIATYALFVDTREAVLARYLLLVPLGLSGIFASAFNLTKAKWSRLHSLFLFCAASIFASNLTAHISLFSDRKNHPWSNPHVALAHDLKTLGFEYGWAGYWDAYYLTFISDEKLIVASSDHTRFRRYRDEVIKNNSKAFVLTTDSELCESKNSIRRDRWIICPFLHFHGEIPAITKGR